MAKRANKAPKKEAPPKVRKPEPPKAPKKPLPRSLADLASGKEPNLGGRPPKLEDTEQVRNMIYHLARMQCTQAEAAAALGVSRSTFSEFLGKFARMREAWDFGPDAGRASLRRLQWISASRGSVPMQRFLGKNWLGQADKVDVRGPGGGPLQAITKDMSDADAAAAFAAMIRGED